MIQKYSITIFSILCAFGFYLKICNANLNPATTKCKMTLEENSPVSKWWSKTPKDIILKVHLFNYTNLEDYYDGRAEKILLNDIGPFVYSGQITKVNITFHENKTISYQEKRTMHFNPELSTSDPEALITFPNIIFLSLMKTMTQSNFVFKMVASSMFRSTASSMFTNQKASEAIWGYHDQLRDLINSDSDSKPDDFGLLAAMNRTSDEFNLHTGEDEAIQLGKILGFERKIKMDVWNNDECNEIIGTDWSIFPQETVVNNQTLNVFIKNMCRSIPLNYFTDVNTTEGLSAKRYLVANDVFTNSTVNESNKCYCSKTDGCPPNGVFNATNCLTYIPLYVSFPHFYQGDAKLFEKFKGLHPNAEDHMTYADIHPNLGVLIGGASRFQLNIGVHKDSSYIDPDLLYFDDGDILPVMWFEIMPAGLSKDDLDFFKMACPNDEY